jgi:hypothetical protein
VVQKWFRSGSEMVQKWFRNGSEMVQFLNHDQLSGSEVVQKWFTHIQNGSVSEPTIMIEMIGSQASSKSGSEMVQKWFSF